MADGLSALAVERHAAAVLSELLPQLGGWRIAPLSVVEQGRVAIGDEIGAALGAHMAIVLLGERPGLSAPDSLGAYITWHPRRGRTDAERNCISNIRTDGLTYAQAAAELRDILNAARQRRLTAGASTDAGEAALPRRVRVSQARGRVRKGGRHCDLRNAIALGVRLGPVRGWGMYAPSESGSTGARPRGGTMAMCAQRRTISSARWLRGPAPPRSAAQSANPELGQKLTEKAAAWRSTARAERPVGHGHGQTASERRVA